MVQLSAREMMMAAEAGITRHILSLQAGRQDQHGFNGENGWTIHVEGACGEVALAKALGVFWSPTANTFKAPDIGAAIQVKTRSRPDYELIVRSDDNPNDIFVLVVGRAPVFHIKGWIRGVRAKRQEWWQTYGDRPGAWFVPQNALEPIGALL